MHQGIVAEVAPARDLSLDELVRDIAGPPLLVVLDGIEDPHNVGAIVRTVDAAGAHGVVRQTRRAAALDAVAAKASAGAVAHVPIVDVVNIARAIEELKALNVWTVGLAGDAEQSYDAIDFTQPTALVLGAEGSGLRRLVREIVRSSSRRSRWPGRSKALNVSVAAGVVLFEAARQRRASCAMARPMTTRDSGAWASLQSRQRGSVPRAGSRAQLAVDLLADLMSTMGR